MITAGNHAGIIENIIEAKVDVQLLLTIVEINQFTYRSIEQEPAFKFLLRTDHLLLIVVLNDIGTFIPGIVSNKNRFTCLFIKAPNHRSLAILIDTDNAIAIIVLLQSYFIGIFSAIHIHVRETRRREIEVIVIEVRKRYVGKPHLRVKIIQRNACGQLRTVAHMKTFGVNFFGIIGRSGPPVDYNR